MLSVRRQQRGLRGVPGSSRSSQISSCLWAKDQPTPVAALPRSVSSRSAIASGRLSASAQEPPAADQGVRETPVPLRPGPDDAARALLRVAAHEEQPARPPPGLARAGRPPARSDRQLQDSAPVTARWENETVKLIEADTEGR
jgi:hypothetical protein